MLVRSRIINVKRKPTKCPICGERVVDIDTGSHLDGGLPAVFSKW